MPVRLFLCLLLVAAPALAQQGWFTPPEPCRLTFKIQYGDVDAMLFLLRTLIPEANLRLLDPDHMEVSGSREVVEQMAELLEDEDEWRKKQVVLEVTLVALKPGTLDEFWAEPAATERLLQELEGVGKLKLLATKRVATRSSHTALLDFGDLVPIVGFHAVAAQFDVDYVRLGIGLQVTPTKLADGRIELKLELGSHFLQTLINNQYPCKDQRRHTERMVVDEGSAVLLKPYWPTPCHPLTGELSPFIGLTPEYVDLVVLVTPSHMR